MDPGFSDSYAILGRVVRTVLLNRGAGGANSLVQQLAAAADTARRALDFAEDYRRRQANDQLDALSNQVDATRNFLDTPSDGDRGEV